MPAYVVRLNAAAKNPHDLVGIYSAADSAQMAEFVDECCNVFECEYAKLPPGGIYHGGPAKPVPFTDDVETVEPNMLAGATFTEGWQHLFVNEGEDTLRWRPVPPTPWSVEDEGKAITALAIARASKAYP